MADAPVDVPKLVEGLLCQALAAGASDLYWLPQRHAVAVRMRVRGVQQDLALLTGPAAVQCLAHVKVLGGLLTYRTQVAQDGVIRRRAPDGRQVELRVAAMPSLFGERLTLRVMAHETTPLRLAELGLGAEVTAALQRLIARPYGLPILTGPTGSGKTTTIYALLRELLAARQDPASILTLEDPIESVIDGITQTAVPSGHDEWTYELALRAALRHDVKTLVVGELRDRTVTRMVLDAALTGHRVITTFHAGDIASVYARLLHQGFEPFLVAAAVTGVLTQRLAYGADGQPVPVVAVLEPDDAWRTFVCTQPDLAALRRQLATYPLADLGAPARQLVAAGKLAPTTASLMTA